VPAAKELTKILKLHRFLDTTTIILTRTLSENIAYDIDTMEKLGPLSLEQKGLIINLRNRMNGAIEDHYAALEDEISEAQVQAAELAGEIVTEYVVDQITEAIGPKAFALPPDQRLTAKQIRLLTQSGIEHPTQRGIQNAMARMQGRSYRPLSRKVYHTAALSKGQLNRMINYHLARESSGRELAHDVRQFVRPDVSGGIRSASLRLGRTELNNAFHAVSVDQARKNPYVTGMRWHTSGSHPRPDHCDDYAGQVFELHEVPNKPHPNCFCYVTPETITSSQFFGRKDEIEQQVAGLEEKTYPPLSKSEFSDPTTPRTRAVSAKEFQRIAAEGERRLATFHDHASPPVGLDRNWDSIKKDAYKSVQSEWGGVTVNAHTGKAIEGAPNAYALTVRPPGVHSVTVPKGADRATFDAAMDKSRIRFSQVLSNENYHLGVFRDDAIDRIDIDPVVVVTDHHDVETIGAYTHAKGGAYNFADGLGYWPPHVEEE
jgi:hypothetical protein